MLGQCGWVTELLGFRVWLDEGAGVEFRAPPRPKRPHPQSVQQNGSIYIHVYFTKSGFHPDPRQKALYRRLATVHMSRSKSEGAPGCGRFWQAVALGDVGQAGFC